MELAIASAESAYGLIYPEQAVGRASVEARDFLESKVSRLAVRGVVLRTMVAECDAASAIADIAGQAKADLVVMSSHGYSGLTDWLMDLGY